MPPVLTDRRNWFDTDQSSSYAGPAGMVMWRTQKGAWILQDGTTYTEQPQAAAFEWLINNGHADIAQADLPDTWDVRSI